MDNDPGIHIHMLAAICNDGPFLFPVRLLLFVTDVATRVLFGNSAISQTVSGLF